MTASASPEPGRRPSWRRRLLFIGGGLLVLLAATYFVVSSSAFFKGVVLPRVSRAVGGEVTVAQASLSPFSQATLRQLTVRTTGTEPLLQVEELRLRYGLFSILGGTLKVDEVTIVSPNLQITENADGTSNLDPLLKQAAKPPAKPAPASPKTPQVDLKNLTLKNMTVRRVKLLQDGGREVAELSGVNVTLDQLKNGQPGKFSSAAVFKMTRPTNEVIEAKSAGNVEFALGANLIPQKLNAKVEHEVLRAEGSLRELAGVRAVLIADVTPGEIKELSARFLRGDKLLGEAKVTGPLDLSKKEGRLKLEVVSIDRQVLNLVGAPFGLDFGTTTLDSSTEVLLTQGGSIIAADIRFKAARFGVTRKGQTTPPLDLQLACNVTMNSAGKSALVQTLTLDGTQNQRPVLRGSLTKPMALAWGNTASTAGDSTFELAVTDFNLADWKTFLGDAVSEGRLSLNLNLSSQQGGKQLKLGLTSQIADLAAKLGSTPLTQAALALKLNGQVTDLKQVTLTDCRLDLRRQSQPVLTVSGSAGYDGAAFNLQAQVEAIMARLTGSGPATPLTAGVKLDGAFTNQVLDLHQMQLALTPTQRAPKNELNVAGRFDLSTPGVSKGRVTAKADTLDLTLLYDAFAGDQSRGTTAASTPPPPAPASTGSVEPEPVTLPLQVTAEANLTQVYLREINIQNCQLMAKVDGGRIILDPFQLTLNGAPARGSLDLNLGVPGYRYRMDLRGQDIPLAPFVNSFQPDRKGQISGTLTASAQMQGEGLTGGNLAKHLAGPFEVGATNLNLKLINVRSSLLKSVVNVVIGLPDIMRNPSGALGGLVQNLSGAGKTSSGGWVDELSQSPIDVIVLRGQAGQGRVDVQRALVESPAFQVETQGPVTLAPILTNSTVEFPVAMTLNRSLAAKIGQVTAETPTNQAYVKLPDFLTLQGTLGVPSKKLNYPALGKMALQLGGGILGGRTPVTGDQVTGALDGFKNALGGKDATNRVAPSTNKATPRGILEGFLSPGPAPATNTPSATNAAPKKGNVFDLLK
jgi:uncharacterized protein involved in outer membrane biogenesis